MGDRPDEKPGLKPYFVEHAPWASPYITDDRFDAEAYHRSLKASFPLQAPTPALGRFRRTLKQQQWGANIGLLVFLGVVALLFFGLITQNLLVGLVSGLVVMGLLLAFFLRWEVAGDKRREDDKAAYAALVQHGSMLEGRIVGSTVRAHLVSHYDPNLEVYRDSVEYRLEIDYTFQPPYAYPVRNTHVKTLESMRLSDDPLHRDAEWRAAQEQAAAMSAPPVGAPVYVLYRSPTQYRLL
jgi:hypothetical protein